MRYSKRFTILIVTLNRLGWHNVIYVAWYKFCLKFGLSRKRYPIKVIDTEFDFFSDTPTDKSKNTTDPKIIEFAKSLIQGDFRFYGYHRVRLGNPPNWFLNPFNGKMYPDYKKHWIDIPDFNPKIGDIKNIWESARFEWAPILAAAYSQTGVNEYLKTLNSWLSDWCNQNPINQGPNWKCGQESGIRIMQLLNASLILQQHKSPSKSLFSFVELSLERISKNIRYSIAQDNNHGTSEAAALYIGGIFLEKNGIIIGEKYKKKGKKWLKERINHLVQLDGSFSQHSVNYHRLLLDSMSFVELWRRTFDDEDFGINFKEKVNSAIIWLYYFVDLESGDAPNLGANDGAFLTSFSACSYRDFRPSLQLASILFSQKKLFISGPWDNLVKVFGIDSDIYKCTSIEKKDKILDASYAILNNDNSWALMRLPKFKFRPSHNDVHHVDLWIKGKNVICDSGTYSYNPSDAYKDIDLKGVKYHNTVYFDQNDPMPIISRFLLGSWLRPLYAPQLKMYGSQSSIKSAYKDQYGNTHARTITKISNSQWQIIDDLNGDFKKAVIGLNVVGSIKNTGKQLIAESFKMNFPLDSIMVKESIISRYYNQLEKIHRIEVLVESPGSYITSILIN